MAKTKTAKRQKDIKSKLIAAICMLLVSTIMMVSSTYAWFTLSTAPEVTGITTAVGANGNLEMALMPKDGLTAGKDFGITSSVGDGSIAEIEKKNTTWGNLVNVSDTATYGLDQITLFPSRLNPKMGEYWNPTQLDTSTFLATPKYGADGRISELVKATVTGIYDGAKFQPSDSWGVRAVGTASGMTERELAFRNALSAGDTARSKAVNEAKAALDNNGSKLANIAIEHGMESATEAYDKADVEALRAMITGLQESLAQIDEAYVQYIVAYAASTAVADENAWNVISAEAKKDGSDLEHMLDFLTAQGVNVSGEMSTSIEKYKDTVDDVAEASGALETLETTLSTNPDATFTWTQISGAMTPLANTSEMTINGYKASEVKQNISQLVSSVTEKGGLTVEIATGGGAFADIADQCGDYWASVVIDEVEYNGITLNNMKARMETASDLNPNYYLVAIQRGIKTAGAPKGAEGSQPISDMYGFIVDLAFRTNAAESKLLLQADAADRIYKNNTYEETMGHGSSMTFKATATDFTDKQVKDLMEAIRIVFFDPTTGDVIALAKLDTDKAVSNAEGITAKIVLYTVTEGVTYEKVDTGATHVEYIASYTADENGTYVEDSSAEGGYRLATEADADADKYSPVYAYREATESETATHKEVAAGTIVLTGSNEIMPLTQNTAHALSVLVYLDGDIVGNDDVAATVSTSVTGTLNLQFASSANLVPMEYADLHIPGADADAPENGGEGTP